MIKREIISLVFIILFLFSAHFWLPYLAQLLIVNDKLEKADCIVVPSGNEENQRVEYAAALYRQGLAGKILFCGQLALQKQTKINLAKIYAVSLGVRQEDILLEEDSATTFENALYSKPIIEAQGWRSLILVTYPVHTRRAKLIFRNILPKDIRISVSCDLDNFNVNRWWLDESQTRSVAYEYFGFIWYLVFRK